MKKRFIAVCLAVFLAASPLFAESQKYMLYRLQDELNALKQQFEWLVDEMTIKFTQLREMNRQGIEELNRHLQSISRQLNDQDGRIRTLEPRVEALESVVSEVAVSSIGDPLPKGTPAPGIGNAVHQDPATGLVYRADPVYRNNIVGVLGADNKVIRSGPVENLSGLVNGSVYYLAFPDTTTAAYYSPSLDVSYSVRYDSTNYSASQGFQVTINAAVYIIRLWMEKVGSPTTGNVFLEIRSDDGTGKPSSTVLATSESLPIADLPSSAVAAIDFHFYRDSRWRNNDCGIFIQYVFLKRYRHGNN